MKITLQHPETMHRRGIWALEFLKTLVDLPNAEFGKVPLVRGRNTSWMYTVQMLVDGKRVAINTREYDHFVQAAAGDFDLILDCHYDPKKNLPNVVPFVMFSTRMTEFHADVERYRKIAQEQTQQYDLGWSGCRWLCRRHVLAGLDGQDKIFLRTTWTNTRRTNRGKEGREFVGTEYDDYVREFGSWRWGLVLYGRGSGIDGRLVGKLGRRGPGNQREHEFAALGVPMIMNYQPTYYRPWVAGQHFMFAETAEAVLQAVQTDGRSVADNAREYWQQNMSPAGIRQLFLDICEERL